MWSLKARLKAKPIQAVALGLASAALVLGMQRAGWFAEVELKSLDWRFRTFAPAEKPGRNIVIVALDDASFSSQAMLDNFGRWPWRRLLYAGLIHYLNQWGARVIGVDLVFQGADPHAGDDEKLAASLAEERNVVLAFDVTEGGSGEDGTSGSHAVEGQLKLFRTHVDFAAPFHSKAYSGIDLPQAKFLKSVRGIGCDVVRPDSDGVLRKTDLLFRFRGAFYPSFALAVASAALNRKPDVRLGSGPALEFGGHRAPLDAEGRMIIRWYGPAFTYTYYPAWKVFNSALEYENGRKPEISPSAFKNKIVLIGATAAGAYDLRSNPFSAVYPGVEMHATVIDNLLKGDFIRTTKGRFGTIAVLCMAGGISALVYSFNSALVYSLLSILAGLLYFSGACWVFSGDSMWIPLVAPLASGGLAFVGSTLTRYATEGREKRKYRNTLLKYLSPQLVETIMQDFNWGNLRAEKRRLTVLFSDVRGFTTFSEAFPPETVIATLNEHLNMMVTVIFKHQGTLDKFVGDCVMAFWGAPLHQPNHAELAARAGLEMIAGLEKLNQKWQSEGRPTLKIGVGINTGEMLFGNIGSEQRMDFTVIGDSVNLGARLESATKDLKAGIVISDATYREIQGQARVRPIGEISVKGKSQKIAVYELLGMDGAGGGEEGPRETEG
jgi:adenylate cyclase